ncbi:unnamed protein product [Caenorhabditis bovis]|uniref:Uncharacterized protein n=1 Tax=Caenorhabditis bovis TaxID=2654633 RepID=A0A8S1FDR2_9PELO|nr:unnamed protein product [Caenorhabditis bovis]
MIRGLNSPGGIGLPNNRGAGIGMAQPAPQQQQQFYDDEPYQANASQLRFKTNMERRETGNLIPFSQRSLGGAGVTPFGSAPAQSFFGSGLPMNNTSSPRKMQSQQQMIFGGGIPQSPSTKMKLPASVV